MPHYADGTPAQAGDLVLGHPDGRTVVGEVIAVGVDGACALQVACPKVEAIGPNQDLPLQGLHHGPNNEPYGVTAEVITAAAGSFDLIFRAGAPSLPEWTRTELAALRKTIEDLKASATPPAAGGDANKAS